MIPSKPIYIRSAKQISIQHPLSDNWISNPIEGLTGYNEAIDPDFRNWMSTGEARRLGKIMKRAVVTSSECMKSSQISLPDAIVTATGLGCVKNTELFLTDLCTQGESLLKPTQFMQSTHNTIGSLVAILNNCHGYNVTYAHGDISNEIALLDAITQISIGDIHTALVGAFDELTTNYYTLLKRSGYYSNDMVAAGEVAVSFMLSDTPGPDALCRLESISTLYRYSTEKILRAINQTCKYDCIVAGYNGNTKNEERYDDILSNLDNDTAILQYKNIFGECMTSSALGIYAASTILSKGEYHPSMLRHNKISGPINSLIFLNIINDNVSIIKLSKV